jgi:uncharacterized membrane protein YebE (DUF533 family)
MPHSSAWYEFMRTPISRAQRQSLDDEEPPRRPRSRATALDALYHAELLRARWQAERADYGHPDTAPPASLEERLIEAYPDEERREWMRRELRRWRGQE